MLIDLIYVISVACGCVSALRGNRTAAALLGATAITTAMVLSGFDFNAFVWIIFDIFVIVVALSPHLKFTNIAISVLYVPIWSLYTIDGWTAFYVVSLLTSLQFFLTFPLLDISAIIKHKLGKLDRPDVHLKFTF